MASAVVSPGLTTRRLPPYDEKGLKEDEIAGGEANGKREIGTRRQRKRLRVRRMRERKRKEGQNQ